MFGSEEFPSTGVSDIAGVFVDGDNFLFFSDGGPVRFDPGFPADPSFFDNGAGVLSTAYNGVSAPITFAALVNPALEVHTLKIATADTNDSIIDCGLFIRATSVILAVTEIVGTNGNDHLVGGAGLDALSGLAGIDTLEGGGSNDQLFGDAGDDTLLGQAGDDSHAGGPGNDLLIGGPGTDTALFFDATGPVQVNLGLVGAQLVGGGLGFDDLREIEDLSGGVFADVLRGNAGPNNLQGREGNDSLFGSGGDDVLFGNDGRDQLFGDAGNDFLVGGRSGDSLAGGPGSDFFAFEEPNQGAAVATNITAIAAGLAAGIDYDRILDFSAAEGDLVGPNQFAFDLPEGVSFLVPGTNGECRSGRRGHQNVLIVRVTYPAHELGELLKAQAAEPGSWARRAT
jgi:Ca2+-binding RTX toxin-like protein